MTDDQRPRGRAAAYRRRARACIEDALIVKSEESCAVLLELAFLWTRLAKLSERAGGGLDAARDGLQPPH
jgi:hypothetical protein